MEGRAQGNPAWSWLPWQCWSGGLLQIQWLWWWPVQSIWWGPPDEGRRPDHWRSPPFSPKSSMLQYLFFFTIFENWAILCNGACQVCKCAIYVRLFSREALSSDGGEEEVRNTEPCFAFWVNAFDLMAMPYRSTQALFYHCLMTNFWRTPHLSYIILLFTSSSCEEEMTDTGEVRPPQSSRSLWFHLFPQPVISCDVVQFTPGSSLEERERVFAVTGAKAQVFHFKVENLCVRMI